MRHFDQLRLRSSGPRSRGFTLIELLVVIGIISVLIACLLPVLSRVRQEGKKVACLSNLRQIGAAMIMYVNDSRGWTWSQDAMGANSLLYMKDANHTNEDTRYIGMGKLLYRGYLKSAEVFRCPAANPGVVNAFDQYIPGSVVNPPGYWGTDYYQRINQWTQVALRLPRDAKKGILADIPRIDVPGRPYHKRVYNVLYLDGYVLSAPVSISQNGSAGTLSCSGATGKLQNWFSYAHIASVPTYTVDSMHP